MRTWITASSLVMLIALATAGAGLALSAQRPARRVAGVFHRWKLDTSGHARGIVQIDLMRQIVAGNSRRAPLPSAPASPPAQPVPSQPHPFLGRPAPPLVLGDVRGESWDLASAVEVLLAELDTPASNPAGSP